MGTYVVLRRPDCVLVVQKPRSDIDGFFIKRYGRPDWLKEQQVRLEQLGSPTHVSDPTAGDDVARFLSDTFFPEHEGLLDDHDEDVLADLESDIHLAMQALRLVQVV